MYIISISWQTLSHTRSLWFMTLSCLLRCNNIGQMLCAVWVVGCYELLGLYTYGPISPIFDAALKHDSVVSRCCDIACIFTEKWPVKYVIIIRCSSSRVWRLWWFSIKVLALKAAGEIMWGKKQQKKRGMREMNFSSFQNSPEKSKSTYFIISSLYLCVENLFQAYFSRQLPPFSLACGMYMYVYYLHAGSSLGFLHLP